MRCPQCKGKTLVYGVRHDKTDGSVIRYRQCRAAKCAAKFQTRETPVKRETVYRERS